MRAVTLVLLVLAASHGAALILPDSPELRRLLERYQDELELNGTSPVRTRRAIPWSDREEIINLHNKLRGQVYPTASNMEFMVWDEELERSATHWAEQCVWDHGPHDLLMSIGQNLGVHWGRYRSPASHVQAWYNEVKYYTYPYPQECNPWCPERCSGPMCTHYTQLVWATTNRVGCAVHICPRMNVWGETWENCVYLVCNYSPKGNWIGEAPYQHGRPCSQCPPSYGGVCRDNLCYKDDPQLPQRPETEDMNEVEKPQVPVQDHTTTRPKPATPRKPSTPKSNESTYLVQNIKCDTKMRDKCRGATCNRYKCPANCQTSNGKVFGTRHYDVQSSICRAAIHAGAIDHNGGLVDITRKDNFPYFDRDSRNGIETFSKNKQGNAFLVENVEILSVNCFSKVTEICPLTKPSVNCPRVFCPAACKELPPYWAPVVGNNFYLDSSSICRAAIHAGVIKAGGGYVDIVTLKKRRNYIGTVKNGILSESKRNPEGNSFRVFAVQE